MTDRNWKAVERKVAGILGGKRIALSGRNNMGRVGDVDLAGYTIEVKSGRYVPKRVSDWLDALLALAGTSVPVLVLQPFGRHERVAILTLTDLARIMGREP